MVDQVYDFIIAGAGTSGLVVAGRLAEDPHVSVLVLEAGPNSAGNENVEMIGGWSNNFDSETDWNFETEPTASINNRTIKESRGRLVGGSSAVNGTLCLRGFKQDFDDWNLDGWSGDELWRVMKKAEHFHGKPWFHPNAASHGFDGPLHLEPHDLAPISELVKESMIEQGLPLHEDMFTTGETPVGCGHVLRTVYRGTRRFSADYVTGHNKRDNITIQTGITVDKVVLSEEDGTGELQATGVEVITEKGLKSTIRARKEVIVAGGAYGSPAILLRSGIGPKDELAKVGLKAKVDLPGVGKNLTDHPIVRFFYEVKKPGLTLDHLVHHGNGLETSLRLYREKHEGILATFPFGIFGYMRLDDQLRGDPVWEAARRRSNHENDNGNARDPMHLLPSQPHVELFNTEAYGGPKDFVDFPINPDRYVVGLIALLFSARSRGSVTLRSADPLVNPVVDHQYLTDPLDLAVLAQGCQSFNDILLRGSATRDLIKGSWPPSSNHHTFTAKEQWIPVVKDTVTTCYHPSGTCKMGQASDPLAVLDERLRVRGVKALRVADVSVMPELNNGHPQMPAYGIGERAAEIIKEDFTSSIKV